MKKKGRVLCSLVFLLCTVLLLAFPQRPAPPPGTMRLGRMLPGIYTL